jgi:hypothetical protein
MSVSLSALQGPERINGKMTQWGCFAQHRRDSKKRKIEFNFSFEEWCVWWEANLGPDWFRKRGSKRGQYVMARLGDKGPYNPKNVKCITSEGNHIEGNLGRAKPGNIEHCRKLGLSKKGKESPLKGRSLREEHREKLRKPKSEETKVKLRAARYAYLARMGKQ